MKKNNQKTTSKGKEKINTTETNDNQTKRDPDATLRELLVLISEKIILKI
jgi:hypothetical protein